MSQKTFVYIGYACLLCKQREVSMFYVFVAGQFATVGSFDDHGQAVRRAFNEARQNRTTASVVDAWFTETFCARFDRVEWFDNGHFYGRDRYPEH